MSHVLGQRPTATHHRLSITHSIQKGLQGVVQMQGSGSPVGDVSVLTKPRLRAETGGKALAAKREPQDIIRALKRMELILDAKRSQFRKMQQLSKRRFIGKLISEDYLDELSADIAWSESVAELLANELKQPKTADPVSPASSPDSLETSA
jgi:hypothetical protein